MGYAASDFGMVSTTTTISRFLRMAAFCLRCYARVDDSSRGAVKIPWPAPVLGRHCPRGPSVTHRSGERGLLRMPMPASRKSMFRCSARSSPTSLSSISTGSRSIRSRRSASSASCCRIASSSLIPSGTNSEVVRACHNAGASCFAFKISDEATCHRTAPRDVERLLYRSSLRLSF